uniref:Uncharacterized protein n=1 Tax=Pseudo-nitzschia australis TaxID=44445 RepID=A0A7S4EJU2_9STRA
MNKAGPFFLVASARAPQAGEKALENIKGCWDAATVTSFCGIKWTRFNGCKADAINDGSGGSSGSDISSSRARRDNSGDSNTEVHSGPAGVVVRDLFHAARAIISVYGAAAGFEALYGRANERGESHYALLADEEVSTSRLDAVVQVLGTIQSDIFGWNSACIDKLGERNRMHERKSQTRTSGSKQTNEA